jgi:CRISPR-associated protein Cas5d
MTKVKHPEQVTINIHRDTGLKTIDLRLKIWGEYALFTQSMGRSDPQTYEVITPTAAVGLLENIFRKPEFKWYITRITILNPIKTMQDATNACSDWTSWNLDNPGAGSGSKRLQKRMTILKDVAYLLDAQIILEPHAAGEEQKYRCMVERYISRGSTFKHLYLGTASYRAFFSWADETETPQNIDRTWRLPLQAVYNDRGERVATHFFEAECKKGIIEVPKPKIITRGDG